MNPPTSYAAILAGIQASDVHQYRRATRKWLTPRTPGPVYLRISRADMPVIFDDRHQPQIGKGFVVRQGNDVTVFANGHLVSRSIQAAERLAAEGLAIRVINIHTIKPLDAALVRESAAETGAVVTAEEHLLAGGMGSAIAEVLAGEIPTPLEMVGIRDTFAETVMDHDSLLDQYGMSIDAIVGAARRVIQRKRSIR